ncbi:hypothetical protein SAMN05216359_105295 [Roseateles sp. YR242]|uniref:hypothetical protein n=1 Tax=Roseateles sp. YR242 TaxID=1855305 RepID=UPI0008AD5E4C|nr:hypothetical protein [Roseateles sp. YR242]SEL12774.1 hypothetical protein SAMN05216359_105295 [Roseateles sp. YR242]
MTYPRKEIREFCQSNPGASLTVDAIQRRFNVTERAARAIVAQLRDEGLLARVEPTYIVTKPSKYPQKVPA